MWVTEMWLSPKCHEFWNPKGMWIKLVPPSHFRVNSTKFPFNGINSYCNFFSLHESQKNMLSHWHLVKYFKTQCCQFDITRKRVPCYFIVQNEISLWMLLQHVYKFRGMHNNCVSSLTNMSKFGYWYGFLVHSTCLLLKLKVAEFKIIALIIKVIIRLLKLTIMVPSHGCVIPLKHQAFVCPFLSWRTY